MSKEVAKIRKKYSSEWNQFEGLVDACRENLSRLPRLIREALSYIRQLKQFCVAVDRGID